MKLWLVAVRDLLPEHQEKSMKQLIPQREEENQTDNIRHQELLFHFGFFQQTGKALDKMGAVRREEKSLGRRDLVASWPVTWQTGSAGGSLWTGEEVSRDSARVSRPVCPRRQQRRRAVFHRLIPTLTSRRPTSFYQHRPPFF